MYHYIYKITNLINGMYYYGRHSTQNLNDGYMGSGKYILNAIKKYGKQNFKKEIIEYAASSEQLWKLEETYITEEMIADKKCYNAAYGGINYLSSLKNNDHDAFVRHQSLAGKNGGIASYFKKTPEQRLEWHKKGRAVSAGALGKKWSLSENTKFKQKSAALQRPKISCTVCGLSVTKQNLNRHLVTHTS